MGVACGLYWVAMSLDVGGLAIALSDDGCLQCPFCPCVFASQWDLDLHLKVFGRVEHSRLALCVAILVEVEGHNAGVDDQGTWQRRKSDRLFNSKRIKACRALVEKSKALRAKRSDGSDG